MSFYKPDPPAPEKGTSFGPGTMLTGRPAPKVPPGPPPSEEEQRAARLYSKVDYEPPDATVERGDLPEASAPERAPLGRPALTEFEKQGPVLYGHEAEAATLPEGLQADAELMGEFQPLARELGLSRDGVEKLLALHSRALEK